MRGEKGERKEEERKKTKGDDKRVAEQRRVEGKE